MLKERQNDKSIIDIGYIIISKYILEYIVLLYLKLFFLSIGIRVKLRYKL